MLPTWLGHEKLPLERQIDEVNMKHSHGSM